MSTFGDGTPVDKVSNKLLSWAEIYQQDYELTSHDIAYCLSRVIQEILGREEDNNE